MVLVRPRQLDVSADPGDGAAARVARVSFQGSDFRLELELAGCAEPLIAHSATSVDVGHTVYLTVRGDVHPVAD